MWVLSCVCARACIGAFWRPRLARFRDLWWSSVGQVAVSCKLTWAPLKHGRRSAGGVLRDALLLVADADLCNFCRGCSGLVCELAGGAANGPLLKLPHSNMCDSALRRGLHSGGRKGLSVSLPEVPPMALS